MHESVIPRKNRLPKKLFDNIQKSVPIVTIDALILRNLNNIDDSEILLIKRRIYPEIGKWCLIGGRLLKGESFEDGVDRQISREFGVKAAIIKPWGPNNPIAVNNNPQADPQKHYVSMLYPMTLIGEITASAGPEWSEAKWFPIKKLPTPLGFNHRKEIRNALRLLKYPELQNSRFEKPLPLA